MTRPGRSEVRWQATSNGGGDKSGQGAGQLLRTCGGAEGQEYWAGLSIQLPTPPTPLSSLNTTSDHVIFSTSPQEHYFDCPYQLSSEASGQTFLDATMTTVELMEEDTVVMGSDGLFDNIFDREIISVVRSCVDVSDAAKAIANLAHGHSMDSNYDSPYSQEARAQGFDVPWWKKIMRKKLTGRTQLIDPD
ncbi:probable protein phosphatase 2c 26 [Phtheirospermum japonicum]|uniref:Protein phosphatase n=1 Tax=Phtheirospermum japonicum TaxID=374723 RepID=A0A830BXK4_9LAMI|nr:probable protein phosphatase 2c 26 [Phtheirospermum japonicum]